MNSLGRGNPDITTEVSYVVYSYDTVRSFDTLNAAKKFAKKNRKCGPVTIKRRLTFIETVYIK